VEKLTLDRFPAKVLASLDIQRAFIVSRLINSAERLQLFRLLHGKRMNAAAIGHALKIHKFYLKPFLDAFVSLGLLRKASDTYLTTPLADKYFIKERSIYWTRQYSKECALAYKALTVLEKALASGRSCKSITGLSKPTHIEAMKRDRRQAEDFTQMLFHLHQGVATALANYLDLSWHRAVLDVGGGSGVMSIALAKKNPHLRACILDIGPVCEIAARNTRRAGVSARVKTLTGDMRRRLPEDFDVIMFCDVGPVSQQLLMTAFKCLPAHGLVVLADRYLSPDGTKPLDRLLEHFVGSSFGLATWKDMVQAMRSCGFQTVKARNVYQDVWFITGVKPTSQATE